MQGIYQVNISGVRSWTIDLSKGIPEIVEGATRRRPTVLIELAEPDFHALLTDPENQGLQLYRSGKLRIEGSLAVAMNVARMLKLK